MQITLDRRRVFVHTGGQPFAAAKPALVLVHGAGTDHTFWALQARFFAHHGYSVLVPDLPGHGRSDGPPEATIPALAGWLWQVLDAVGAEKAALVGHSMGSLVALAAAAAAPQRATALVLLGSAPKIAVHADLVAAAKDDPALAIELITEWGFGREARLGGNTAPGMWMAGGGRRLIAAAPAGALAADLVACDTWEGGPDAAAKVVCPTLLLAGGADRMTPPRAGETLAKAIAGARMEVFPDTGHMIMVERPNETTDAIHRFLASVT
ncbi:MAG: alpha/beta fold hydrolase [Alphaproteobacteria bacterium]